VNLILTLASKWGCDIVVIDHYSKWGKAKVVGNHGVKTTTKILEDDVICRYGVPNLCLLIMEGNG